MRSLAAIVRAMSAKPEVAWRVEQHKEWLRTIYDMEIEALILEDEPNEREKMYRQNREWLRDE